MPAGRWANITFLQQITKQKCLAHLAPPDKAMMVVKRVSLTQRLCDVGKALFCQGKTRILLRPCKAEGRGPLSSGQVDGLTVQGPALAH